MPAGSARKGIQSVEVAFRLLTALQTSQQAVALKDVAAKAKLSPSAANNYLVSLVRTRLAAVDSKPGFYRLGPAALALGMSAIQQIDGLEVVRREVIALREATQRSAAVSAWTDDGPVSLYKQEGEPRGIFELRTGLLPLTTTAAGRLYVACLPAAATAALVRKEHSTQGEPMKPEELRTELQQELHRRKYVTVRRAEGYTSIAAPVWDHHGEIRFALSLIGSRSVLQTERGSAHVKALLGSAERATLGLGGRPALGDG